MPTAQQKKRAQHFFYLSHTAQIREVILYVITKSLLQLCNKLTAKFKLVRLYNNRMIENTFVVDCFAPVGVHQHDIIILDNLSN